MSTLEPELALPPSFPSFRKLPTEIQISIWTYSLLPPRITPRIIRLSFNPTTSLFTYRSTPPPLLQTCHLSRLVALKHYLPLLPSSSSPPIYFLPQTDILHCNPSYTSTSSSTSTAATNTPPPFLDPALPAELIHHIILTQSYISQRARTSFLCPIPELRYLVKLETLYIELPTHKAREEASRNWYRDLPESDNERETPLPPHLTAMHAATKRQEGQGRRDVVPGYVIVGGKEKCMREQQVMSCFGWQEGGVKHAWLCGDKGYPVRCDEYWEGRGLPVVEHLREVEE
ncbi:hypothetical protein CJF32_00003216 [Rutstroemia sp. NJR-2017a WRK4]|nr:hypothetical protein CJF32_00003216 [Rutstroemia sp. NJR-2017a WRK4]